MAGMEVTEQLETLSVACDAAGGEGSCGVAEEHVPLRSEDFPAAAEVAFQGPSGAGGAGTEGLLEAGAAGPSLPVPDGGGVMEGPLELPATDSSPSSRPAVSANCTWPSCDPGVASAAGGEPGEKRSQDPPAPAEGEDLPGLDYCLQEGPPPPLGCPASCLGLTGCPGEKAVCSQSTSPGTAGQGEGGVQSPCNVVVVEKEQLIDESGAASAESDSGSESDTDTDSSSSVSSTSSCSPVLSEEDDQQYKNDENSHNIGKKAEVSEQTSLPVEDLKIFLPESVELMPIGKVSSIIENLVIVESLKGLPPVNEDSVLFRQDRHSIGKVFEVFGPVSHPFYALQFNSHEHTETKNIKAHDDVYFAPSVESFTQYIFPEKLKQEKGSDASWKNDEEPPLEALDFSDDEKEKAAKQQKKSQNLRRKKFRSQDECNENGIHYQPRRRYPSDYSSGSHREKINPSFSRGRFPHSPVPPHSYRQQVKPPQHYGSDYTGFQKPPAFFQHQRKESPRRQQYSFPPASFGTVSNEAIPFPPPPPPPPPPPTWGWPRDCVQNTYDPLLSLLSLPPPPPPPLPPPSTAPLNNTNPR